MTADDRREIYLQALKDWSIPSDKSNTNHTNTWFDVYFDHEHGIEFTEDTLPELYGLMEDKYFDLPVAHCAGFIDTARQWRVSKLKEALEIIEQTL
jgi:hypothetical protein